MTECPKFEFVSYDGAGPALGKFKINFCPFCGRNLMEKK